MPDLNKKSPIQYSCYGWTAVEVAVVAGLVLIVVALSLPIMNRNLELFCLDSSAYAILNDLQLAKIQALKKNTSVTLNIDIARSSWQIAGGNTRSLSRNICFSSSSASSVTFDSRGYSIAAGTLTITLSNSLSENRTIRIQSSGKVTVS
jgi:Tfp pilus assembly protein FimT